MGLGAAKDECAEWKRETKMGIIQRLFGRPDPKDVFRMPTDPEGFLVSLRRRKFWRQIDVPILESIVQNAHGEMELLRNFVFISEQYRLVERNFLAFAANPELIFGSPAVGFGLTLYRLGSDLCKQVYSIRDTEQIRFIHLSADMAFTSAVLCDPWQLEAYVGMALLYGDLFLNKKVALEWCSKYKNAEDELASTPDERLSMFHRAAKEGILHPELARQTAGEIAQHAPNLLDGQPLVDDKTRREEIEELERRLVSM